MNPQQEFISDIFHVMAQPITALRTAVELGLAKNLNGPDSQRLLGDCLRLIERLMQDLSVLREMAELNEEPPLQSHEASALLEGAVAEMLPVAEAGGIQIRLRADPGEVQCHEPLFSRALFLILDDLIGHLAEGGEIQVAMSHGAEGMRLQIAPATAVAQRQKLCRKLLQFAGGGAVSFSVDGTTAAFRESIHRHNAATTEAHKQLLTTN